MLSPAAAAIAGKESGSWLCSGVGIVLFDDEDPFWWRRVRPENEESREADSPDQCQDHGRGKRRRNAVMKRRERRDSKETNGEDEALTDMEMLEVLDPARAARIRIRMARYGKTRIFRSVMDV